MKVWPTRRAAQARHVLLIEWEGRQAGWEGEEGQDMRGRAFLQDESQQGSAGSQGETGHKGAGSEGRAGW